MRSEPPCVMDMSVRADTIRRVHAHNMYWLKQAGYSCGGACREDASAKPLGSDIFFSKGAYQPGSHRGKQLLAHELTHVVQQGGARPHKLQTKHTAHDVKMHSDFSVINRKTADL